MIEVLSFWRNDADSRLEERARHLLDKTSGEHEVRWLWSVGDSSDETLGALLGAAIAAGDPDRVRVHHYDTGIAGDDIATSRRRLSAAATAAFAQIDPAADYVCLHESDLQSPEQVLDWLLLSKGGEPTAGWPTIDIGAGPQFYDTWAYRDLQGRSFTARPPYSRRAYRARETFQVGSFGSVWIAPAALVRDRELEDRAVVELCEQWREEGHRLWCNPEITIKQPADLWTPR